MRMTPPLVAAWVLCVAIDAQAQAEPPAIDAVPVAAPVAAVPTDAWGLYDSAFSAAVSGRDAEALSTLSTLLDRFPKDAAAIPGRELVRLVKARQPGGTIEPRAELTLRATPLTAPVAAPAPTDIFSLVRHETPSNLARAEFITGQTINGIALASEWAIARNFGDGTSVLFAFLGAGAGAWGSVSFSSDGITPGHALAINSGAVWGAGFGLTTAFLADSSDENAAMVMLASQAAGTVLGHYGWKLLPSGAGDVALANTAGIWAGAISLAVATATVDRLGELDILRVGLVSSSLGLAGGVVLSRYFPMTRSRTLLLDAGGIVGALVVAGVGILTEAGDDDVLVLGMAGGAVAGIGAAYYLTRQWDVPELPVSVGITPTGNGALLSVRGAL